MDNAVKMPRKVIVNGYVSSQKTGVKPVYEFYVFETTNYLTLLPGMKVDKAALEAALAEGVTVIVKRK